MRQGLVKQYWDEFCQSLEKHNHTLILSFLSRWFWFLCWFGMGGLRGHFLKSWRGSELTTHWSAVSFRLDWGLNFVINGWMIQLVTDAKSDRRIEQLCTEEASRKIREETLHRWCSDNGKCFAWETWDQCLPFLWCRYECRISKLV